MPIFMVDAGQNEMSIFSALCSSSPENAGIRIGIQKSEHPARS